MRQGLFPREAIKFVKPLIYKDKYRRTPLKLRKNAKLFTKEITGIGIQKWKRRGEANILRCNRSFFLTELTMNIVADILPYTLLIGAMVARYLISVK